jgi:hypothetical protein
MGTFHFYDMNLYDFKELCRQVFYSLINSPELRHHDLDKDPCFLGYGAGKSSSTAEVSVIVYKEFFGFGDDIELSTKEYEDEVRHAFYFCFNIFKEINNGEPYRELNIKIFLPYNLKGNEQADIFLKLFKEIKDVFKIECLSSFSIIQKSALLFYINKNAALASIFLNQNMRIPLQVYPDGTVHRI